MAGSVKECRTSCLIHTAVSAAGTHRVPYIDKQPITTREANIFLSFAAAMTIKVEDMKQNNDSTCTTPKPDALSLCFQLLLHNYRQPRSRQRGHVAWYTRLCQWERSRQACALTASGCAWSWRKLTKLCETPTNEAVFYALIFKLYGQTATCGHGSATFLRINRGFKWHEFELLWFY